MDVQQRLSLLLDFDQSAGQVEHSIVLQLSAWQEMIRFGCTWREFKTLQRHLQHQIPAPAALGCVMLGSGDYHHITQLLLSRLDPEQPIHLIVCDNHPDQMRYPFGIHCGSWVYWASKLKHVARIDVIGISSSDITLKHAWENHWTPLIQGKVHYWSVQQSASWMRWIGAKQSWHGFDTADQLMATFIAQLATDFPVYLSIDKDVLSQSVVKTNWDQGSFLEQHLMELIQACQQRLIGADITGDVSAYHYKNRFKRMLSASDGQAEPSQEDVLQWQVEQQHLNRRLLAALDQAWVG
ncbi:hypothetical protein EC844_14214 [Acinetobacter calcoaceticus]|uniref:Arginase family protein n=1 Tax=Acinetobacter calcoaceticus TaxID=471 RepID=A0A4R1XIY2_ACICA|nr:hypothetical protein EC844_14214 [Acinetobacter calcoaceticus]